MSGLAAALIGGVVGCGSATSSKSGPAARPSRIVVDGKPLVLRLRQPHVEAVFPDPNDARLLRVRISRERPSDASDRCTPPVRPFAYVEREDENQVTVGVGGYLPVPRREISGASGAKFTCMSMVVGYRLLPVRLRAPLGERTIRDAAADDRPLVVTEKSVPTPAHLPPGYVARPLTLNILGLPERSYRHGPYELDIVVGSPDELPISGRANTTVRGHPAVLHTEGSVVQLSWRESANRVYEVSDFMADQRDGNGGYFVGDEPDLSPYEVLEVARTLR